MIEVRGAYVNLKESHSNLVRLAAGIVVRTGADVERFAPRLSCHLHGVEAADDAREAEDVVDGAHGFDGGGDAFGDGWGGGDVDFDAEDPGGREIGREGYDGGLRGAECGLQVPEAEAGAAVFEKGAGGAEGQGAGATCDCRNVRSGMRMG